MDYPPLMTNLTVAELLARWPEAVMVLVRHQMACVGCAMAPFETLAEVAAIYRLPTGRFLDELEQSIQLAKGSIQ